MKVSIIGTGLQFSRRAQVLKASNSDELVSISGLDFEEASKIAHKYSCHADMNWMETVSRDDVEAIIVCTPPSSHAEISIAALRAGKHVLCEKPLSRSIEEAIQMVGVAKEVGRVLKCGFNHRHHQGILEAKKNVDKGYIGRPAFARCRYGICGRPDYSDEWRANPSYAAGGQLIEQGIHGIDLIRWFTSEFAEVACMTSRHYFRDQTLEDDGFAIFRMRCGASASLHTSLLQWQNLFSFEVYGDEGYFRVEGLGGAYGVQTLYLGKRDFHAPFQDHVIQYRGADISWSEEWKEFVDSIQEDREPIGSGNDGLAAMKVAVTAYEAEKCKKTLCIN